MCTNYVAIVILCFFLNHAHLSITSATTKHFRFKLRRPNLLLRNRQATQVVLLFVRIIFATNWEEEAIRASALQEGEQHEVEDSRSGEGGEKGAESRAMSVPKPDSRRCSFSLPVPMGSGSYKQAYNMPGPGSYKAHQPIHSNGARNGTGGLDV